MENANEQEKEVKKEKGTKREKRKKTGKGLAALHILQHLSLVMAVVLTVIVLLGIHVSVDTPEGTQVYNFIGVEQNVPFEETSLFHTLLGKRASDIICYGTIRGQLETNAQFDTEKEVDVTAFASRYWGTPTEYITARYYLDDLIQWAQAGFTYEDVYMSGEEVDRFLSRTRKVTKVDLDNYSGGTLSYLNADLSGLTTVVDVSGNLLEGGITDRETTHATLLHNRYYTVEGKKIEDHVSSWEEYYELCSNVQRAAEDLNTNYNEYLKYKNYYDSGNSNVVYFIRRTIGNDTQVFSNMQVNTENLSVLKKTLKEQCGKYLYYNAKEMQYETNTPIKETTIRHIINGYEYSYPEDTQIMIGVLTEYAAEDCFYQAEAGYRNLYPNLWQYLIGAVICGIIYLALLVILTMKEGKGFGKDSGEIFFRLQPQDGIPTEIMLAAGCVTGMGFLYGIMRSVSAVWEVNSDNFILLAAGMSALFGSLLFSFFYYSFVRRIKAKTIWKESLTNRFCKFVKKWAVYGYEHSTVILRVWVPFICIILLNLICGLLMGYLLYDGSSEVVVLIGGLVLLAADGAAGYALYHSALARQLILDGIKLIKDGNLTHKVDEEGMHGDNLLLAQAVNSIGDSVRTAVETSMKDERLKADLITNVSHDIKTPLTSIINYVDLIKRENVQEPKIREYIEVLDQKSQRLKQLTDDLVEASKISSGNIVLQWEKINLVELLNQAIGEFSEKFEQKALYPVMSAPMDFVYIRADSRRIWRVIENLFNNIFKYALPGTRVYIDLEYPEGEEAFGQVQLSVKNISAQPLKVNPAELTERFIRGDESRTTEGSGLGLSIAKNLTEVQGGKFEIVVDGDLFKVNLIFPVMKDQ